MGVYEYAKIVHLFCAIIFVGYLFFDVVVFKMALKKVDTQTGEKMKKAITSSGVKIMPFCVLLLLLTGGLMMTRWVGSNAGGYFNSNLQIFFMIKVLLAFVIFIAVATNLSCKFIFKRPSPLGDIHPLALILSAFIVFLAVYFQYAG